MTPALNIDEIRQRAITDLCSYDPRNPSLFEPITTIAPRSDCYCDNCFHGKDRAAVATLALCDEVERLRGIKPTLPERPRIIAPMSRFGIRWNGPDSPLAVPMDDGYWTPWHAANAEVERLRAEVAHWKANHDEMKARNDALRDRLDLDAEKVKPRLALLDRYDALVAENAKLRDVAEKVMRDFPPYREVEHVDNGPDDPKEVPTGELLCGSCAQGLEEHDADCLYAMAERALANGGAGGGE